MEKQPDEPEDFTNEPLPSMSEPMEVQDAVASTIATPFAQSIIAASKSRAQKQREYRQRIAASRTPAQAAAARKSRNERQRKYRLRQAAIRDFLEATTTSSSTKPITAAPKTRAQIQREYRQRITASKTLAQAAAAKEARNISDGNNRLRRAANLAIASGSLEATTTSSFRSGQSTSSDQIEVQAQSTWNTKWATSIMRFKSTFLDNDFGYACSVCDRLWFKNDLKPITAAQLKVISDWFIKENRQLSREEYKLKLHASPLIPRLKWFLAQFIFILEQVSLTSVFCCIKHYFRMFTTASFRGNAFLVYHKRTHFEERAYKCSQCDKAFYNRTNLQVHEKSHSDSRPYSCSVCFKAFKSKGALDRHFRCHSGLKPYECEVCGRAFSQSNSRKVHVRTVHLKQPAPYVSRARLEKRKPNKETQQTQPNMP
ncbi:hypothetical protein B5X24_HaOG206541 [Helicoverpa armigera]|uniref:C2H2-type domain-containing protein n=1 Tax=Helicoverpa armigera TaxID=29058 RepID=A0A2W1BNM4_HELAM|nr:hypothetical protein B5X24_HaOG206541 [Helicoverpa armigera]